MYIKKVTQKQTYQDTYIYKQKNSKKGLTKKLTLLQYPKNPQVDKSRTVGSVAMYTILCKTLKFFNKIDKQ